MYPKLMARERFVPAEVPDLFGYEASGNQAVVPANRTMFPESQQNNGFQKLAEVLKSIVQENRALRKMIQDGQFNRPQFDPNVNYAPPSADISRFQDKAKRPID